MTTTSISTFENAVQVTHQWLNELDEMLALGDAQKSYRILRSVLMALRDRLTIEEATDLAAQLPVLVRGVYYENWNPSKTPTQERSKQEFLNHVGQNFSDAAAADPEQSTRAVFKLLANHITESQVQHVRANLPADLQELWP